MRVGAGEDGGEGGEEGDPWELTAPSFTFRRLPLTGSDRLRWIRADRWFLGFLAALRHGTTIVLICVSF